MEIKEVVSYDLSSISYSRGFFQDLNRGAEKKFNEDFITEGQYRPWSKHRVYFDKSLNEMTYLLRFSAPIEGRTNRFIVISGTGVNKPFSCLMTNSLPDLQLLANAQCFPLWYWEEASEGDLFASTGRQCGLTGWFIEEGRKRFGKDVTPEDLFYYIYGLLHTKSYRETFQNDVKKALARVTLNVTKEQYVALRDAGRKLGDLHVNYEAVPPHPEVMVYGDEWGNFKVEKLKHPKKGQTDQIVYNSQITIGNIPEKAYRYEVNGRSAIGWILDRYQVKTDKKSGIVNDPNDWAEEVGNPRYILDLILSVIHVSTQTVDIVDGLPEIDFEA